MKKRILSIIIILAIFLNIMPTEVSAQKTNADTPSPIYKVVVPTNYSFIVDPYKIIDENSMISSPEFCVINKSSVPIEIDISFQLSAKEGVLLDIMEARNMVGSNSYNKEIWLAVVFNSNINNVISENKILRTKQGDIVYRYSDGIGTNTVSGSAVSIKTEEDELQKETYIIRKPGEYVIAETDKNEKEEKKVKDSIKAVSGSAILVKETVKAVSGSAILLQETVKAMSGSAISAHYGENNLIQNTEQMVGAVSGSAISVQNEENNLIQNTEQMVGAVSGSAISVQYDENSQIQNTEQKEEKVDAASGSAISIKYKENSPIKNDEQAKETVDAISGSAIIVKDSDNLPNQNKEDNKENVKPEGESDTNIQSDSDLIIKNDANNLIDEINKNEDMEGIPIRYQDTIRVFGQYGDINRLNEKSPNVLVINNEWNTMSIALEKAEVYTLSDGTIVTGEIAKNNKGVATFRFIGEVNTKVIWSETELKTTIKYTIHEPGNESEKKNENENEAKENTAIKDNGIPEYYMPLEEVKTRFNNYEEQTSDNLYNDENNDIFKMDIENENYEIKNSE